MHRSQLLAALLAAALAVLPPEAAGETAPAPPAVSKECGEPGIADRPLFYFGILALIIGTQLFLTGFVGEMINRNSATRNHYLIEKEI